MSNRVGTLSLAAIILGVGLFGCARRVPTYDIPPILVNRKEVTEALHAVGRGTRAEVVLMIHVDTRGQVRNVRVQEPSGDDVLDDAALWVGERMRFRPAEHQGRRVPAWVRVPVTFDVVDPGNRPPQIRNASGIAAVMSREYSDLRGVVRLRVRVGLEGMITAAREERADDEKLLRAALDIVDRVEFWPGLQGFEPVDAWVTFVFEFDGPGSRVYVDALEVRIE